MRRINRSQVEIFNFSFLDILACTIALLIFIMVMVFVLQSGSTSLADTSKIIDRTNGRATALEAQARTDDQIASKLEEDIEHLSSMVDRRLLDARTIAKTVRDKAQSRYDEDENKLAALDQELRDAQNNFDQLNKTSSLLSANLIAVKARHEAAEKRRAALLAQIADDHVLIRPANAPDDAGADSTVLHVDCQRDKVVLMKLPADGKVQILGSTPVDNLESQDSAFAIALAENRSAHKPVIVFWVRPDGLESFSKAKELVPVGVDYGYEPAASDWQFGH